MATEDAQIPIDLAIKFCTEHLEPGDPVSFYACATKFGVKWETLHQYIAGRESQKEANIICHGLHLRRSRFFFFLFLFFGRGGNVSCTVMP